VLVLRASKRYSLVNNVEVSNTTFKLMKHSQILGPLEEDLPSVGHSGI